MLRPQGFTVLEAAAPGHVEAVRSILFDPLEEPDVAALGAAVHKVWTQLRGT